MRVMRGRRLTAGLFAIAVAFVAALIARPYVHGLSFVIRAAEMQGAARRAADFDTVRVSEREVTIPTRRGPMRARLYEPAGSHRRAALLTSGLHASGIDEPRLVRLAQQLAASHIAVVTPDIPELSRFEIAPAITDAIEDAGVWLADESTLAPDRKAALMGISFSGGLSIIAAGRPSLANKLAYIFSLGGHDDLPRVLKYLCTGHEPSPIPDVQLGTARDSEVILVIDWRFLNQVLHNRVTGSGEADAEPIGRTPEVGVAWGAIAGGITDTQVALEGEGLYD